MVMGDAGAVYHPGQSATLRLGPKTQLASFGMVHPATLKAFDIDVPVAIAGIHPRCDPSEEGEAALPAPPTPRPPCKRSSATSRFWWMPRCLPAI
jgi:phenylalanyl-tRNA synthetase beta chain